MKCRFSSMTMSCTVMQYWCVSGEPSPRGAIHMVANSERDEVAIEPRGIARALADGIESR